MPGSTAWPTPAASCSTAMNSFSSINRRAWQGLFPVRSILFAAVLAWALNGGVAETGKTNAASARALPDDWAFRPLQRPLIPEPRLGNPAQLNPIDAFIQARLAEQGMAQSPEAE